MTEQQIAYRLKWDLEPLQDTDFTHFGEIAESTCPNFEDVGRQIRKCQKLEIPEQIVFDFYRDLVIDWDYPYTDTWWPIMSKRMLDVLLSVGKFAHQAIPVNFRQERLRPGRDDWDSEITEREFYLVNLLEPQDVFDWDRSEYTLYKGQPHVLDTWENFIFKEPKNGLPPFFRLPTVPIQGRLFISEAAKLALEKANIKGTIFVPQKMIW